MIRKIYESLNSVGVGTHTFKYPDIRVNISNDVAIGLTSTIPEYYKGSADPIVRGKLENIFFKKWWSWLWSNKYNQLC